jgi:catechol 2,3-dioxygenase-like lactoylglutathione lyase family enzyme
MTTIPRPDLFAGVPVSNFESALPWYERLLGSPPAFFPHREEAVWELAEHRYLYIVQQPDRAGRAILLLFVDNLEDVVREVARRGIEAAEREPRSNGVRKVTYRDPDGNELSFGGA